MCCEAFTLLNQNGYKGETADDHDDGADDDDDGDDGANNEMVVQVPDVHPAKREESAALLRSCELP